MKRLMSGNEAVARGLFEAGVKIASAYPGTPSTEIIENLKQYDGVYSEWAPNEKVATEVAYGASIAGVRSVAIMKHVGINVAADPMFNAVYDGVEGGFIIISADDPSMHSSQNEQDNRHYARAAKMPMFEPSDSQECLDMIREAYEVSERFDTPVLFRMTTRVCHSKSLVEFGEALTINPIPYKKNPAKYISSPGNAMVHRPLLEERLLAMAEYSDSTEFNKTEINDRRFGVIASGISVQIAREVFPADYSFLSLGFTYPLPEKLIRNFAEQVEEIYVLEELDPFLEEQIKALGIKVKGKDVFPNMFELNPAIVRESLSGEKQKCLELDVEMVARPPSLCPGCPHRGFFYSIRKQKKAVIAGDIGCYTLGGSAPLSAIDTVICMGAGFSAAMGMAKAFEVSGEDKVVFGVVGDSTFFHSGITGAIEILYNKGRVIPVVLDNSTTSMTGQQDNPGTGLTLSGEIAESISIEELFNAIGFKKVIKVDPQDLTAMEAAIDEALAAEEPCAMIVKRPCVLIKNIEHDFKLCVVDRDLCTSCRRCLGVGCSAIYYVDGKAYIDPALCTGCTVCMQVCNFDAISVVD
ncbi:MAG TPA: indolepyruvate ferredoxin oxidoreductase subunit alpha [Oscillospiraceae bacterium]|nr:indolepyruvate ferredoxin oxidoreductase subunit alpha [Oscillospiraceae bacterium]